MKIHHRVQINISINCILHSPLPAAVRPILLSYRLCTTLSSTFFIQILQKKLCTCCQILNNFLHVALLYLLNYFFLKIIHWKLSITQFSPGWYCFLLLPNILLHSLVRHKPPTCVRPMKWDTKCLVGTKQQVNLIFTALFEDDWRKHHIWSGLLLTIHMNVSYLPQVCLYEFTIIATIEFSRFS